MRATKTHPNHTKTRLWGEIERAMRGGAREIELAFCGLGTRRKRFLAMHLMGDRVVGFYLPLNPEASFGEDFGRTGPVMGELPGLHYEGRGLHSLTRDYVRDRFLDGQAFALVPRHYRVALAGSAPKAAGARTLI